ncbi:MAG: DUF1109 domain-containing protein [Sphingomonadales bacterium]|nr:DUF1109 domain-containing protein [Sphingomonadales bacterium]
MQPEELVKILAADAKPVQRLASPMVRLLIWLGISIAYAALVVWLMGLRPDIAAKLADTRFAVELAATFMTSVLAAAAAFCAGCPGRPIWERFAPLPALALWFWSLGEGCWRSFAAGGTEGLSFRLDFVCLPSILLVSIVPGALMLKMIRRGAPIAPVTTTALAALAAGALGAAALRLFHAEDASVMVLAWQFGSVVLLASLGALSGRHLLPWPDPRVASS